MMDLLNFFIVIGGIFIIIEIFGIIYFTKKSKEHFSIEPATSPTMIAIIIICSILGTIAITSPLWFSID